MDKPKPNQVAHFYSGQILPSGAVLLRRPVPFYSGVDTEKAIVPFALLISMQK
jgi:hypothetical protein